jgi:hypothetical protein
LLAGLKRDEPNAGQAQALLAPRVSLSFRNRAGLKPQFRFHEMLQNYPKLVHAKKLSRLVVANPICTNVLRTHHATHNVWCFICVMKLRSQR